MRLYRFFRSMIPVYILILAGFIGAAGILGRVVTTEAENAPLQKRHCIIVDAGHGGIDGGATSCTGVLESQFNLEIAVKLNDLLHLLGVETRMVRLDDVSIYTEGETISAKKISDLKERVRIVNETSNSVLVSIHMNYFSDERYYGPQVFYSSDEDSKMIAGIMQENLNAVLYPESNRKIKKADGIYLMQNINRPGILIECGFISNPAEEFKLRDVNYQKKLCTIIATQLVTYISNT